MENWIKAGKIASQAREFASTLIKENISVLEITEKIENFILKKADLAFPVQLSINNIAAHQTPLPNDKTILKKKSKRQCYRSDNKSGWNFICKSNKDW